MKSYIYSFVLFFSSHLYGQQCVSNAGLDKTVCGGKKIGSNTFGPITTKLINLYKDFVSFDFVDQYLKNLD